jgi:uncharacterized protein (DUF2344 family)
MSIENAIMIPIYFDGFSFEVNLTEIALNDQLAHQFI